MKATLCSIFFLLLNFLSISQGYGKLPNELMLKLLNPSLTGVRNSSNLSGVFSAHTQSGLSHIFRLNAEFNQHRRHGFNHAVYATSDGSQNHAVQYRMNLVQHDCRPGIPNFHAVGLAFELNTFTNKKGERFLIPDVNFGISEHKRGYTIGFSVTSLTSTIFHHENHFANFNSHFGYIVPVNRKINLSFSGVLSLNIDHVNSRIDAQIKGRRNQFLIGTFFEFNDFIGVEFGKRIVFKNDDPYKFRSIQIATSGAYNWKSGKINATLQLTVPFYNFRR